MARYQSLSVAFRYHLNLVIPYITVLGCRCGMIPIGQMYLKNCLWRARRQRSQYQANRLNTRFTVQDRSEILLVRGMVSGSIQSP